MATYARNTKGQEDLAKLQGNEFKLFSRQEVLDYDMPKSWKDAVLYVSMVNSFRAIPSISDIRPKLSVVSPRDALKSIEEKGMLFDFTIPEIVNFYGIEPVSRKNCLPKELSWLYPYIMKMTTKSNGTSWNDRKENPRQTKYPLYYVAKVIDSRNTPCYEPLGLHIKR